jgi:hypothetical protein
MLEQFSIPSCELAQKRTEANLDAAHARPIVSSAPIRKEGWPQRSVPLRVGKKFKKCCGKAD